MTQAQVASRKAGNTPEGLGIRQEHRTPGLRTSHSPAPTQNTSNQQVHLPSPGAHTASPSWTPERRDLTGAQPSALPVKISHQTTAASGVPRARPASSPSPYLGGGPLGGGKWGGERWMSRHLRAPLQSTDRPGRHCRDFGDIMLKCGLVWVFCREETIILGLPTSNRHRTIRKHCFSCLQLRKAPEELQVHRLAVTMRPACPWTCVTSVPSPRNPCSNCHHVTTCQSLN